MLRKSRFVSVALSIAFFLHGCGGGGGGSDGGNSFEENSQDFVGVVAYDINAIALNQNDPTSYSISLQVYPFDVISGKSAEVSRISSLHTLRSRSNTSEILGTQNYDLLSAPLCTASNSIANYDAFLLLDRSESITYSDPQDAMSIAGKEFIGKLGIFDRAQVAQFPGTTSLVEVLSDMTGDIDLLTTAMADIKDPVGSTALWDALDQAISIMPESTNNRAILVFSDGADTGSVSTLPSEVIDNAIQENISLYAINFNSLDPQQLNQIAFDTGGAVFSTNSEGLLVVYYQAVGQLLAKMAIKCTLEVLVSIDKNPLISEEIGYGPVSPVSLEFNFDATTDQNKGSVATDVLLPYYPGKLVGLTDAGIKVFESDYDPDDDGNLCVETAGSVVTNACTRSIYYVACFGSLCTSNLLNTGESDTVPYASFGVAACAFNDDYAVFVPAIATGAAPESFLELWNAEGLPYDCYHARRFLDFSNNLSVL